MTKIHNRNISSKQAVQDKQYNSDGKDILFIYNTENMYRINNLLKDNADFMSICNNIGYKQKNNLGLDKSENERISYLPEPHNIYKDTKISLDNYMKAVQNRQYKYITIRNKESDAAFEMFLANK